MNPSEAGVAEGFQRQYTLDDFRGNLRVRLKNVEIPELHAQHEQLVELIVRLYGEVRKLQKETPNEQSIASLRTTLQELKSYASRHFREEETFMTRIRYPGMNAHLEAHRQFVQSLLALEARLWQESISFVVDLLHLVVEWLFAHINQMDMGYALFAKSATHPKSNKSVPLTVNEMSPVTRVPPSSTPTRSESETSFRES
ncbi:MAG: hemerythrin family protein, partial [Magnetococcales bacterium]|nr:hemerythrin family protein [Magnetococcales bacterium]